MIVVLESGTVGETSEECHDIGDAVVVTLQDENGNRITEYGVIESIL